MQLHRICEKVGICNETLASNAFLPQYFNDDKIAFSNITRLNQTEPVNSIWY